MHGAGLRERTTGSKETSTDSDSRSWTRCRLGRRRPAYSPRDALIHYPWALQFFQGSRCLRQASDLLICGILMRGQDRGFGPTGNRVEQPQSRSARLNSPAFKTPGNDRLSGSSALLMRMVPLRVGTTENPVKMGASARVGGRRSSRVRENPLFRTHFQGDLDNLKKVSLPFPITHSCRLRQESPKRHRCKQVIPTTLNLCWSQIRRSDGEGARVRHPGDSSTFDGRSGDVVRRVPLGGVRADQDGRRRQDATTRRQWYPFRPKPTPSRDPFNPEAGCIHGSDAGGVPYGLARHPRIRLLHQGADPHRRRGADRDDDASTAA